MRGDMRREAKRHAAFGYGLVAKKRRRTALATALQIFAGNA